MDKKNITKREGSRDPGRNELEREITKKASDFDYLAAVKIEKGVSDVLPGIVKGSFGSIAFEDFSGKTRIANSDSGYSLLFMQNSYGKYEKVSNSFIEASGIKCYDAKPEKEDPGAR